jgi:enamine deaminase RidA (YjgF/YER057c/UK114 family)
MPGHQLDDPVDEHPQFPAHVAYEKNRYSRAVRANGLLFVSGQVGSRPDGPPARRIRRVTLVQEPAVGNTAGLYKHSRSELP